ncbi:MAG: tetratricopeptide repeat protein [Acidobacteria bacterium]|nr:MAG: tetratricopeptide repeat protein [Acidobacteriota bacterium]
MVKVSPIRTMGALIGALLALAIASGWTQDHRNKPEGLSGEPQPKTEKALNLSDEEWGDLFMARKTYDAAIDRYSLAINSHKDPRPDKTEIASLYNKVGICYQQKMDYGRARKAYNSAIRLDKNLAQAWNNLGTTYYLDQRAKKSIKYYRRAIKLDPQVASFHLNVGTAYFARKKYQEASNEYRTAIQLDPEVMTRNSTGVGTAVETRHTDAKYYFYLAKIFASTGNTAEAVRYLEHAMEEGFKDRKRILDDPDLQKISNDPAFVVLMKHPPVAIKD